MPKKPKKPEVIPIESLFLQKGFRRNFEIELRSASRDHSFTDAIFDAIEQLAREKLSSEERRRERNIKGGQTTAESKKAAVKPTHAEIAEAARRIIADGKARHNVAGILAQRFGKSDKQIRRILTAAGI